MGKDRLKIVTVARFDLPRQGWLGRTPPDPQQIGIRPSAPRSKPLDGFFTSSWDPTRRTTEWLNFLRDMGSRDTEERKLWLMDPDPEARLFVIAREHDYDQLAQAYPHRYQNPLNPTCHHDWSSIECMKPRPFDGVHMATEAAMAPRQGWDVESTLWFDLEWFTSCECIGYVDQNFRPLSD